MPFISSDWLGAVSWLRVAVSFLLAIIFSLAAFGVLKLVREPQTFAVIDARSEFMEFTVFNPALSIIHGAGLKISGSGGEGEEDKCAQGAFLPSVLSRISYQRIEKQALVIVIDGKGEHRRNDGSAEAFDGEVVLYTDKKCGDLIANRFPIWGPGKIGSALSMRSDGPGPILLEGSLATFGRTIDLQPFGWGGAIYSAGEPLTIPSGGYIESNTTQLQATDPVAAELTALFGYVALTEEPGLDVHVTTETPRLQVSTPGVRENSSRIEVGLFAQVLNDPTILAVQLFFVLLVLLWPITIDLVGLALSNPREQVPATSGATQAVQPSLTENIPALKETA